MKKAYILLLSFIVVACNMIEPRQAVLDGPTGDNYSDDFGGQVPDEPLLRDEIELAPYEAIERIDVVLEPEAYIPVLSSLQLPEEFGATREQPFPTHTYIETNSWDFKVLQVLRGETAWKRILADDPDPMPPPSGYEYVVVELMIRNKIPNDWAYEFGLNDIFLVGDHGILRTDALWGIPSLDLFFKDIYCAEVLIGWLDALILVEETNLLLGIHLNYELHFDSQDRPVHYIALEQGAALASLPGEAYLPPNNLGPNLNQPAALGTTVITETWEITVLEVMRGEPAMMMVTQANRNNPEPDEGYEYLTARLRMRYRNDDDTLASLNFRQFSSYSSTQEAISPVDLWVTSDQRHHWITATFFPGGILEAWTVITVPVNDSDPLLVFNASSDWDIQSVYLALN